MYCGQCGKELAEGTKNCPECGTGQVPEASCASMKNTIGHARKTFISCGFARPLGYGWGSLVDIIAIVAFFLWAGCAAYYFYQSSNGPGMFQDIYYVSGVRCIVIAIFSACGLAALAATFMSLFATRRNLSRCRIAQRIANGENVQETAPLTGLAPSLAGWNIACLVFAILFMAAFVAGSVILIAGDVAYFWRPDILAFTLASPVHVILLKTLADVFKMQHGIAMEINEMENEFRKVAPEVFARIQAPAIATPSLPITKSAYFSDVMNNISLFSIKGRIRRRSYFWCCVGLSMVVGALFAFIIAMTGVNGIVMFLQPFAMLAFIVPYSIRRCHDSGLSPWLVLAAILSSLVPFVGGFASFVIWIIILAKDSTPGDNAYGPYPKKQ